MAPAAFIFIFISSLCLTASFIHHGYPQDRSPYIYQWLDGYDAEYLAKYHYGPSENVSFSLIIHQIPVNSDLNIKQPGAYLSHIDDLLKTKFGAGQTEADLKQVFKLPNQIQKLPQDVIRSLGTFGPAWLMTIMRPLLDFQYKTVVDHIHQNTHLFSVSSSIWLNEETQVYYQPQYSVTKNGVEPNAPYKILEKINYEPNWIKCDQEFHTKGVRLPRFEIMSHYFLDAVNLKLEFFNTSYNVGACNSDKSIENTFSLEFKKFIPSYLAPHYNETVSDNHSL